MPQHREAYIERLSSADSDVRRTAVYELGSIPKDEHVPLLVGLLADPVKGVQEAAVETLKSWRGRTTVLELLPLLRCDNIRQRNQAIDILNVIALDGLDAVLACLTDPDDDVRIFSASILASLCARAEDDASRAALAPVGAALTAILNSPNPNVRSVAVEGLGNLRYVPAVHALVELVNSDTAIQFEIILALGRLQHPAVVEPLLRIVTSGSDILRYAAVDALSQAGDGKVLERLLDLLTASTEHELKDTLLKTVADLAQRLNRPDCIARLNGGLAGTVQHALGSADPFIRRSAAWVARQSKSVVLVPALMELLFDLDEGTVNEARAALAALGGLAPERTAQEAAAALKQGNTCVAAYLDELAQTLGAQLPAGPFLTLLTDENQMVRATALSIIGRTGAAEHAPAVLRLLTDIEPAVRLAAVGALANLGSESAVAPLLTLVRADTWEIKESSGAALYRIMERHRDQEPAILRIFSGLLTDPDDQVRQLMMALMGRWLRDRIEQVLVEGSRDNAAAVREEAVKILGDISGACRDVVFHTLMDESGAVRKRALLLTVQKQNPQVLEKLLLIVKGDPDLWVRFEAVKALGELRNKAAVTMLKHLYKEVRERLLKMAIIEALADNGEYPVLEHFLTSEHEPEWREALTAAIASGTGEAAVFEARGLRFTDQEFVQLRDYIHEKTGIYFSDTKRYMLESRLEKILAHYQMDSFTKYFQLLRFNGLSPDDYNLLYDTITIHESYFFRELHHYEALTGQVLPELAAKRNGAKLRIWSAGCSTGEEPYTMAIWLRDHLGLNGPRTEVLASDLSELSLATARRALYQAYALKELTPEARIKYFDPAPNNLFRLKDVYRDQVRFSQVNLCDPLRLKMISNLDVIFCRNVIIYFSDEAKRRVIGSFYDMLSHGGYLMLGHSESLHSLSSAFKLVRIGNALIYRKE